VGDRSGNLWVIRKGVKAGEQVIAEGVQKVRPGMKVRPVTAAEKKAEKAKADAAPEAKPEAAAPSGGS